MGRLGLYLPNCQQGEEGTEWIRILSRKIGFSASKNRQMFIEVLLHMLANRGIKKTTGRLSKFLCLFYTLHRPENIPLDAFALWNMIRNVLDPCHEAVRQPIWEAIAVGGGSPLLRRSYFLPLMNRRGLTGPYGQAPWWAPPPLHKPLKTYLPLSDLRWSPPPSVCASQSLQRSCLKLKKIKSVLHNRTIKAYAYTICRAYSLEKTLRGPHPG